MRIRLGCVLLALLSLFPTAPRLRAADDAKVKEAKDEKYSPGLEIDYSILSDVPELEPNDTPAQANLLGCGNTLRPASIAVQTPRDTDWVAFSANAGDIITFGTDADGPTPVGDTRISILRDDGVTVLGTNDDRGLGNEYSLLSICAPYTGTYYGRIAAFSSQTGTYMAFLTCAPSTAPNDQCADAINIPCGSIDLSGSTANACPDYTLPNGGCTRFAANGRDVVYKVNVLAGDSLYLDYVQSATDASIYLVTDCADPAGTCVVGEDSTLVGGHETLSYKFTSPGTYYIILDSFSVGSSGPWTATGVLACAPDQIDTLTSAHADVDLVGPWGTETIAMNGSVTLGSTIHALRDSFGTEQVPIEILQLELTGNSLNAGPVTLRLRPATAHPFQRSVGVISETTNATPGVLDLPPFTPSGSASVQISTFVELELPVLKLLLHNDLYAQLYGLFSHLPPGAGDSLVSPFNIPLVNSNEAPTAYSLGAIRFTPNPAVTADTLANPRMTVDLLGPLGLDTVTLKGTTVVKTKLGNLGDTDGDGLEQAGIEVATMNLSGVSLLYGPIQASLAAPTPHALPVTTGEIEENVNTQTARLDLPPFAVSGTASSYFDLFLRVLIDGVPYHNHVAKHMIGTLTQLPPAPGEQYRNFVPTPLLDDGDNPSPFQARRLFFTPYEVKPDGTQLDSFPASRLVVEVNGPWGFDEIIMSGMTRMETYLGTVQDGDDDGLEQMGTRLTDLEFTSPGGVFGHIPGPVTLHLTDTLGFGEIEESVNYTPGMLDLPPFTPVGDGLGSFFEVLFEMEIPGFPALHNLQPAYLGATLRRVPVGPGDTYHGPGENPLVDSGAQPSGITIVAIRLTPWAGFGPVGVPEAPIPDALAIRDIRPNPTHGSTTVTLALPRPASARVTAYDVNGRLVRTLWNGPMEAGVRTIAWDGRSDRGGRVPGGIYFIRLESENQLAVRRLAILR